MQQTRTGRRGTRGRGSRDGEGQEAAAAPTEGDKMPQTPGRRGTRRAVSALHKPTMHRTRSAPYPVGADLDDATANAWKEKNKEYRGDQIHCGGGARPVLGEYAKLRRLP